MSDRTPRTWLLGMFLCACSGSPSGPGVDAADTAAPETRGDAAEEDAGGPPPSRILAATPPMGWNSWNLFACDIDQDLILSTAEAMVESGMAALGYEYVNLDDCWQVDRDADGVIVADPERFPDGIAALADAVHALGLKLGVYTCAGTLTCQERPGSFGYEALDMATYAAWGVDYVKVDWCFAEELDAAERYGLFRDGIAATGREMMLSICNWGFQEPWVWGPETGQLWRTSGDIQDSLLPLLVNLFAVEPLAPFAGPGRWNDPDMLEVGNGGMDNDLYRAHFGLWAILAAPLLAGNDLRDMDPETLAILTNPEIIAVDQDALGLQAVLLRVTDGVRVYARPLAGDGIRAVLFFNPSQAGTAEAAVTWEELGLTAGETAVRDLFAQEDLGVFPEGWGAAVPPLAAVMVRVEGTEPVPAGTPWVSELPWKHAAGFGAPPARDRGWAPEGEGPALLVDGETQAHGIGVPGGARLVVHLGGACRRFVARAGLTDHAGPGGSVTFEVHADGTRLWESGVRVAGAAPVDLDVDVTGRRDLQLVTTPAGDTTADDLAAWAGARLYCD